MHDRFEIIDDFFAHAEAMRAQIDRHFGEPARHGPEHQVWSYDVVPEISACLRARPEAVIDPALVQSFADALSALAFERYGLGRVGWPTISLHVAGCGAALRNAGGRLGYMFSLTRWDGRRFGGGETLLLRDQPYFGTPAIARPAATRDFYDLVPPAFNRLLVFDSRVPHAVTRVDGGMDPTRGRLALDGHFTEAGLHIQGPLPPPAIEPTLVGALHALSGLMSHAERVAQGLLTLRIAVAADGGVAGVRILLDRLLPIGPHGIGGLSKRFADGFAGLRFPAAGGPTRITIPIKVGALPTL